MISKTLRDAVRLHPDHVWRLARRIDVHPSVVSKWLTGSQPPRLGDQRVIALGALVGVPAGECFAAAAPAVPDRVAV
jgi:hypothetical protein